MIVPGWLWLISGVGFIAESSAQVVGVTQPSYSGAALSVNGRRTYVVQEPDCLSTIAAKFYNGDQSRWMDIYSVPENRATIGSNPDVIYAGMVLIIP